MEYGIGLSSEIYWYVCVPGLSASLVGKSEVMSIVAVVTNRMG